MVEYKGFKICKGYEYGHFCYYLRDTDGKVIYRGEHLTSNKLLFSTQKLAKTEIDKIIAG